MAETLETMRARFGALTAKIRSYQEALGVLHWDLRTGAPPRAVSTRSETIGMLSAECLRLSVSEEMGELLAFFEQPDVWPLLHEVERASIRECRREYDRNRRIPPETYRAFVALTAEAESVWEEAKKASDFKVFLPYLRKIVNYLREFAEIWGYREHPYDALLQPYEPGMTVARLDRIFGALRPKLAELVRAVAASGKNPDPSALKGHFPVERQKELNRRLLCDLGYDFEAGRLDESAHPFAIGLGPGDVRITTRYSEDDLTVGLFGTIHECGHALYEQYLPAGLYGTPLWDGASMGVHESQSRLWENMIGRSRAFWDRYLPVLREYFPEPFGRISTETFYRAVNAARPSLIRTEADELTYNLHIIVRYEIEKSLFDGRISADDLPTVWNDLYADLLGVRPGNDAEGVLQDVHWAGGSFGYFPSYALGNVYAAQLLEAMRKTVDVDGCVADGRFEAIRGWLHERVWRYGKQFDPEDLIEKATGSPANPDALLAYLQNKYGELYGL
mgnify:FL=1